MDIKKTGSVCDIHTSDLDTKIKESEIINMESEEDQTMNTTMFLILLSSFSVITGLVTETIKKVATDKANLSYNIVAIVTALIVGGCGTAIYYQLNGILFTANNIIYIILMGLASGITSMNGFDKVSQALSQISNKNK